MSYSEVALMINYLNDRICLQFLLLVVLEISFFFQIYWNKSQGEFPAHLRLSEAYLECTLFCWDHKYWNKVGSSWALRKLRPHKIIMQSNSGSKTWWEDELADKRLVHCWLEAPESPCQDLCLHQQLCGTAGWNHWCRGPSTCGWEHLNKDSLWFDPTDWLCTDFSSVSSSFSS